MKYFTYELLSTMNNESLTEEQILDAEEAWNTNSILYKNEYNSLMDRLPTKVYSRFIAHGFHGYLLEHLNFIHTSLYHTSIDFILATDRERWKLSFKDVSHFSFTHLYESAPYRIFHPDLDSWVREEFCSINNSNLSFEVLFQSGATIQLQFEDQNVTLEKL